MNELILINLAAIVLAALVGLGLCKAARAGGTPGGVVFANIAEGTHLASMTKKADAAISTRYLLLKAGTDADHVDICGAVDKPEGVSPDEAAAAEDRISFFLLGIGDETRLMVASEAITAESEVYTAAAGKVQNEPAVAGTYYHVGKAKTASAADGDLIEVEPCKPQKLVVIAALGNADNEIGGLAIGASYTQSEVQALRDKCEELADDVRAIAAAVNTDARIIVL